MIPTQFYNNNNNDSSASNASYLEDCQNKSKHIVIRYQSTTRINRHAFVSQKLENSWTDMSLLQLFKSIQGTVSYF